MEKALETQLRNIQTKTGKSLNVLEPDEVDDQLIAWIEQAYHSAG